MRAKRHIYPALLLLMAFIASPGCGERSKESAEGKEDEESQLGRELKEAGEHLKEAGKIAGEKSERAAKQFGDLLSETWQEAREGAFELKEELGEAYRRNLDEAKARQDEWRKELGGETDEVLDSVAEKIAAAEEKLAEFNNATEENWETDRRAFNVAWEELRDAIKKAKAEFAKPAEEGTPAGRPN